MKHTHPHTHQNGHMLLTYIYMLAQLRAIGDNNNLPISVIIDCMPPRFGRAMQNILRALRDDMGKEFDPYVEIKIIHPDIAKVLNHTTAHNFVLFLNPDHPTHKPVTATGIPFTDTSRCTVASQWCGAASPLNEFFPVEVPAILFRTSDDSECLMFSVN